MRVSPRDAGGHRSGWVAAFNNEWQTDLTFLYKAYKSRLSGAVDGAAVSGRPTASFSLVTGSTKCMTRSERQTDIALALLAGASIAGIVWIGRIA